MEYYDSRNKVLCTMVIPLAYGSHKPREKRVKMQIKEIHNHDCLVEQKEKVDIAMARLQSLKCKVAELRLYCEELKKWQSESQTPVLVCNECGKHIKQGQEVILKDSLGKVKSYYHKDCFKGIWRSQIWIFDYSSSGFLRMAGKSQ